MGAGDSTATLPAAAAARAAPAHAPVWEVSPGLTGYEAALARMHAHATALREGRAPELVWLLEHPPTYTAGTSARAQDLVAPGSIPAIRTGRGGQWTYHGPGQRIAYVLLDLTRRHGSVAARDLHAYVDGLERWGIAALASLGVHAVQRPGRVGLWVPGAGGRDDKIMAIGVRVSRWVSYHGIAINLAPSLAAYDGIIPCGIAEHGVTSLQRLGVAAGAAADMSALDHALRAQWDGVFGAAGS